MSTSFSKQPYAWAVIPAMLIPTLGALIYFVWMKDAKGAQIGYGCIKVFILLWPWVAWRWILRSADRSFFDTLSLQAKDLRAGGIVGGLMCLVILGVFVSPMGAILAESAPAIRSKVEALGIISYYVPFALGLSLVHSLLEEYYWRWFVYGQLRQWLGAGWAVHALAGLAFASHHIVVTNVYFPPHIGWPLGLSVGVAGAMWSWLYQRSGSLIGAWVAHMMADLAIMAIGYHWIHGSV